MPFRDPFIRRLEEDRKLRRQAGALVSGLLPLSPGEVRALIRDVRALIGLMEGIPVDHPIGDDAAALYAKLGGTAAEKRRIVRLLELWISFIETGVVNVADSAEFAMITGNDDLAQARHLKATQDELPLGDEILAAPAPKLRIVK